MQSIAHLLEQAEKGSLTREEFYRLWPAGENETDPLLTQFFLDVENAVEHLPGNPLTGKADLSRWRTSHECRCIVVDRQVIELIGAKSSAIILEKRRRLLSGT